MAAARHGVPSAEEAVAILRAGGYFVSDIGGRTDEEGAAALLACSRKTLQNWRAEGYGPPCYKASRWLYPIAGVLEFMHAATR